MNSVVHANFQERVEVEIQRNWCKVFDLILQYSLTSTITLTREINLLQNLTKWLVDASIT